MKSTGIIRRIDELGRIVLPKEIRDNLNIQNGDSLEIYINGNEIILEKHDYLKSEDNSFNLIDNLSSLVDMNIFITNKDKVITKGDLENKKLDNNILNIMNERKIIIKNELETYLSLNGYFAFYPIIKDSDLIGLIILYKQNLFNNEEILFGKVIQTILQNK